MNILNLAFQVGISKKLKRSGWVEKNIKNPESVAEHAFRTIVLAMVLASSLNVDQAKLIKMAIIHDLGEISTGDLIVQRGKNLDLEARKKKEKIEKEAIKSILWEYEEEYYKLFNEMIERKTKEAIVCWEIDKLEMVIQAYEYQKEQKVDLSEFFITAESVIKNPLLKEALDDLKKKIS